MRLNTGLQELCAVTALLAAAGASSAQMISMPMMAQPYPGMRGRQFQPDMDWDNIDDAAGDGSEYRGRGRGGDSDEQRPPAMKTDIGKALMNMDFTRDPARVLDARVKLAVKRRNQLLAPEGPPAPEPDQDDSRSGSMDGRGIGEMGVPGMNTPAMAGEGEIDMSGVTPLDIPGGVPDAAALAELMRRMNPGAAGGPEPADGAEGGPGISAGQPGGPISPEKANERRAAMAAARRSAEQFRLMVIAGDWKAVGEFLRARAGEDAKTIYNLVLSRLVVGDSAVLPDEVIEISEAAPQTPDDKQVQQLGALLASAQRRGADASAVAAHIKAGTAHFGGPNDGDPAGTEDRAAKRKRAASMLVAAGLTVEAQAYLAPLDVARQEKDAELLNLYTAYFDALAKKKEGPEKDAILRQSWQVALEVLAIKEAKPEQRRKALASAVRLLPAVPTDAGDPWLRSLFAPTADDLTADVAWMVLEKTHGHAAALKRMQAPPEVRSKHLATVKRVGQAVMFASNEAPLPDAGRFGAGLDMLTTAILDEADYARMAAAMPQQPYNPYGGGEDERNQFKPISSEELAQNLPDERWLLAIDPGLAAKLELLVAATQGGAGDVKGVLGLIKPVAGKDPARALKLAEALLKAWPTYTKHGATDPMAFVGARARYNRYGGFYGGYGGYGGDGGGGIPLTRAMQQRHLAKLRELLTELAAMNVGPLPAPALVEAFAACHSSAEVYALADVQAVFGPLDTLSTETRMKLTDAMRQRLAGMWRSQQVQQQAGTKRTEQEIAQEVIRGYDVAMQLAPPADESPTGWQGLLSAADLNFDLAEYLYGRKADLATYTELRESAFRLYARAAERYTAAVKAGAVPPSPKVFSQWFNSALGASDLGFLTRQEQPAADQIDAVTAALAALPEPLRTKHTELFALAATAAMTELNPELKHRFATHAVRVCGQVPQARELRAQLALYEDLQTEVQLNIAVDGTSDVGHAEPFGAVLSVWSTVSVSRESGGFGKYLNPNAWNPQTGEQIDYKELIEKKVREALAERFEVVSVLFNKPDVKPVPIEGGGRTGWEQTPLAYLMIKVRDAAVDRIPVVQMDMDFRDNSGTVILPIASSPVPIDARAETPPDRTCKDVALEFVLDDRTYERGSPAIGRAPVPGAPEAPKAGELLLEVRAKAIGLIPALDKVIDPASIAGFAVAKVEDHGTNIVEMSPVKGHITPTTERSWTVRLKPSGRAPAEFNFPSARPALSGAKITTKRYSDADITEVKGPVVLPTVADDSLWWWIGGSAAAAFLAACAAVWFRRRARANAVAPAGPRFTMPRHVTPVTAIATLRHIHSLNGAVLSTADQQALLVEIKSIEKQYFAPDQSDGKDADLAATLRQWIAKAERGN